MERHHHRVIPHTFIPVKKKASWGRPSGRPRFFVEELSTDRAANGKARPRKNRAGRIGGSGSYRRALEHVPAFMQFSANLADPPLANTEMLRGFIGSVTGSQSQRHLPFESMEPP